MRTLSLAVFLCAVACALATRGHVNNTRYSRVIEIHGNILMHHGQRWSPKGIAYQPEDGIDPLEDRNYEAVKALVDGKWKELGINCVRVYQVSVASDARHRLVMDYLLRHGIYVVIGAVDQYSAIDRSNPYYGAQYAVRLRMVAEKFAPYENVLAYSIGNEVLDSPTPIQYPIPSIMKAGARDLRRYMKERGFRQVPIMMAERDDPRFTLDAAQMMFCGSKEERMDILGYNCYRWGEGTLEDQMNAYGLLHDKFKALNAPVPVIFTEFGANTVNPRLFHQIPYLYGEKDVNSTLGQGAVMNMAEVFSGGFVFRFYEAGHGWGLLHRDGEPTSHGGYSYLVKEFNQIHRFVGSSNGIEYTECQASNPYNLPLPPPPF